MENYGLRQEITLSTLKTYRVSFFAKQLTGTGALYSGVGFTDTPFFSQVITSEFVEYSYIQTPSNVDAPYDTVYFGGQLATGAEVTNTFEVKDVSVKDTAEDWFINAGWSIGDLKALSDGTVNDSNINQQGALTDPVGKTFQVQYKIEDYVSGSLFATVGSVDSGTLREANGEFTDTILVTSAPINLIGFSGGATSFNGSITNLSTKLLGTYSDQSIYVTAADVQTIPQASVYYLVELTSMGSKNSIYFLPSSVVPNNGRYTKLNFTVVSKDALPTPASGIISFYDSVGGFDTYPMGFYEFKIYEQTSSTNLDPLLATGLLEKGFAFVRDFSGNMQELTDGFKEYNPTLTQYVYSK